MTEFVKDMVFILALMVGAVVFITLIGVAWGWVS